MGEATMTPVPLYDDPLPSADVDVILDSLRQYYEGRRDALLRELAAVERELGYGGSKNPTTAQIRNWYRRQQHDGKRNGG